jgi:hypothetical protein
VLARLPLAGRRDGGIFAAHLPNMRNSQIDRHAAAKRQCESRAHDPHRFGDLGQFHLSQPLRA